MPKWAGKIGFASTSRTAKYVDSTEIIEKPYTGDLPKNDRRWDDGDKINGDITISNKISVIANDFMLSNLQYMRYATFQGAKWKVTQISVAYPRVTLTLGELYNETHD